MVEAQNGQVIYTATETVKEDDADQGNEGIDIGNFHLPFKLPNLPSDSEIYDHLSHKMADVIVNDLTTQLKDTDLRYEQAAEHAAEYGDLAVASRYAAFAYVIAESKQKNTEAQQQQLLNLVFQTVSTPATPIATPPAAVP